MDEQQGRADEKNEKSPENKKMHQSGSHMAVEQAFSQDGIQEGPFEGLFWKRNGPITPISFPYTDIRGDAGQKKCCSHAW